MAATPKPLRTEKKAGAARGRVATQIDNSKLYGTKPPSKDVKARYDASKKADTTRLMTKGTTPQREARGEKGVKERSMAFAKGLNQATQANKTTLAKKSVVAPAFKKVGK